MYVYVNSSDNNVQSHNAGILISIDAITNQMRKRTGP